MKNTVFEEDIVECPHCGYLINRYEISMMKFALDVCPRCGIEYLADFIPHKKKDGKE